MVVGGGIVGMVTAYYLAKAGVPSVVIERDAIGSHASGFAYGGLSSVSGFGIPGPRAQAEKEGNIFSGGVLETVDDGYGFLRGESLLPGLKTVAGDVLKMPVRVSQPENITGMADALQNPCYSTSVGLLKLGLIMDIEDDRRDVIRRNGAQNPRPGIGKAIRRVLGRLLPGEEEDL